jgi:predicted component of type VI protein secretion system
MSILPKLKFKGSSKVVQKTHELKHLIIADIQSIDNYQTELKFDKEIVERVSYHVENFLSNKKYKDIDKKQIVIDILTELFKYTDTEIEIIRKDIEYLYNNKIIKRIPFYAKVFTSVANYVVKKLS